MNDIEKYLDQACKSINGPDELRQHLRQELKEHLDEAIEALVAEGASREEATRQAMEGLGEPETIRDGMESVYNPGVTSLFVDEAIKWRDRKWHIATQVGLALIVGTVIGCTTFMLIFIVPKLHAIHEHLGIDGPAWLGATISCAGWIYENKWICLALLLGAWGLFEWKCRSENKAHLRSVIGVILALLSVLATLWFMSVIAVWLSLLAPSLASAHVPISQIPVQHGDHYYQIFERPEGIEWNDAKTRCETQGGYLVIINDAEENAFLTSIGAAKRRFHLGASDADTEGVWRWVDGSPMTYQNWHEGDPIDDPRSIALVENYLSADPAQWPEWADGRSRAQGFICEWDRLPESNAVQRIEAEIGVKQQQGDKP